MIQKVGNQNPYTVGKQIFSLSGLISDFLQKPRVYEKQILATDFPILPSENEKVKKFIYKLKITNFQLNILATLKKKKKTESRSLWGKEEEMVLI